MNAGRRRALLARPVVTPPVIEEEDYSYTPRGAGDANLLRSLVAKNATVPIVNWSPSTGLSNLEGICAAKLDTPGLFTVQFEPTTAAGLQKTGAGTIALQWTIEFGDGSTTFERIVWTQAGRLTVPGTFCNVSVRVAALPGSAIPSSVTGQLGLRVAIGAGVDDPQARVVQTWKGVCNADGSAAGTGHGYLAANVALETSFCALREMFGVNAGPNLNFLWAIDSGGPPAGGSALGTGAVPGLFLGAVGPNQDFSMDLRGDEYDFTQGIFLLASTTPTIVTADGAAVILGNYSLLIG